MVGPVKDGPLGYVVASGCNGSGLSAAGGIGRLVAKIALSQDVVAADLDLRFEDYEQELVKMFDPDRFGDGKDDDDGDAFDGLAFRGQCIQARAEKLQKSPS